MKKALSVFLSLLMVITTISVVFTLPASAVGVTLYSEDFEGFGEGDKYVSTKYLPSGNGWMATAYSYNTVQTPTEEVNGFTTSEGKIAAVQNWTAAMYVFDVEPNTTYTVGADFWQNSSRYFVSNSVRYIFSATDITGIAEGTAITNGGKGVLRVGDVSYTATTKQEVLTSDQWVNTTLSFTTGANSTKYAIVFENQNNDKVTEGSADASVEGNVVGESSAIFRCLYIDNVLITYEAKPTVKTITYGADNKNGGVAWVDSDVSTATEGMSVTYKAMPYESSLFDGWYVNGNKVSTELTYTQNSWALNDVVEAKFEALAKNYFEDGSGENAIMTAGSSAPIKNTSIYKGDGGNGKAWSNGSQTLVNTIVQHKNANSWDVRTASRTISADNWVGSSYGGIATNNNAYIDSVATGVTAYSGKSVYNVKQASHSVYKVVRGLEKNTDYIVTYYIYQYGESADFNASYAITGIATNATAVYMSDGGVAVGTVQPLTTETVVKAWGEEAEVVTGQTSLQQSYIVDGRKVLGAWTKHSVTFNTGDYNDVLVNFYSAKGTFIDHICLYSEPEAVTPTVSSESNFGSNDGIVYDVTDAYYEGDTFQATAMPYDNATFVGWFKDDVKVSTDLTATLTYNENSTYKAKFSARTENLFEDGSGENAIFTAGSSEPANATATYKGMGGGAKAYVDGAQNVVNTIVQHSGPESWDCRISQRYIAANNWVGASYAALAINNSTYINSIASGVKAYSGNNAYHLFNKNGHGNYKAVRGLKKNTDYILTYYIYNYGTTNFNHSDASYAITGIPTDTEYVYMYDQYVAVGTVAPSTSTKVTDKWGVEADVVTGQTRLEQSYIVDGRSVLGKWTKHSVTFNTGDYNDVLVNFYSSTGAFFDHISLYEQPVTIDLEALVQVDKGGYNNVGLVQTEGEVYIDGDEFTIAATPYANATLDGLYVDGEKVENGVVKNLTTTYELTYKAGSTYVVKFNAFAENIFPDASLEGITPSISTRFVNSPAGSVKNAENPILSNGWIASVYGRAYVATGSQLSSIAGFENVTAYAGNNVLYTECPSHQAYRLLNVEANSNYKMIYYVYAPAGAALNVDNVYGIKAEGDTVTWADMNPQVGGETGQSQIPVTVNDYAAAAGQWVKREVTFNTGAHTRVLIPFGSKPVLFDHVTVYRLPNPTTVSIGVAGGNLVVGDKYASTLSYELGEQVTVTAEPYANTGNTFLGWYTDASCTGEAFSTEATLSVTATDGGTYFAKFKNNSIVADSGFENLAIGEITSQGATTGFYTSNAKIYVTNTINNHDNLSAYAGNNMLKVNSTGGTVYYNVGAVRPYTSYIVSFKVLLPEEGQEVADWRQGATKIVGFADVRSIDARNGEYKDIVAINGNQYEYEENKITYHTISEGENGTWKQVTAIVNSYEFDELKIGFGYNGTTDPGVDISMYVDDFTVVEAVNATASVETLNPFGDEASAQVGGYAYAKNSYTQAAISGSGNATGVTLVATPVNGGVFLGWYQGENKVSSETTYECEITEATSFVAKFAYNGFEDVISSAENLLTFDGSFEEYAAGTKVINNRVLAEGESDSEYHANMSELAPRFDRGSAHYTLGAFSEWGKIFATSRYAYDGSNSLYLNTNCNASFIMKLGESGTPSALETNTKYVLSFYYFYPKSADYNADGNPDFYIQQIGIVEEGFELKGSGAISSYLDSKEDANGKKLLYGAFHQGETVYGEWTKVEIPFTTTETAGATLSITAIAGTKNTEQRIYLDKFELKKANVYETAASTAFNNSVERGGVAIRVPNAEGTVTQALRFKARIAKERLEAMTLGANYTVVEYGSLAMNAAYIKGANDIEKANNLTIGYTNSGKNVVKGVTYNADKGTNKVFAYKQGEKDLIFTAALTGIGKDMEGDNLAKAYKTDYIVRTYAILRLADGTEVTVYDTVDEHDTFSASIYAIAKLAVDDPEVDQTTKTYLQKQIIDICEAAPEEGVASSYSSSFTGKGLSNEEKIKDMFVDENIFISGDKGGHNTSAPTYYTSDNTIRVYKENTLTLTAQNSSAYSLRNTGLVRVIKSVEITYKSSNVDDGDADPTATANVGTVTYSEDENKLTISDINASEVVITFNGKAKIINIKVNYTEQAPCTEHVYTDNCDEACDNCYAVRNDAPHNFASDCDAVCDCGETREATGEHTYRFVCSTECSVCGATREADHVYNEGFCECGAKEPTEKTVSVVVEDYASANSWANGTKYTSVIIAKNSNEETIVSATASGKSSSGDTGKYYTSGKDWRFYQTDDSKLTISATAGYIIKSVKVTYSNSNSGVLLNGTEQAASGDVVTVNAQSITLKVGNKGTNTNGQARITAIEVVYDIVPECAPEDHVYDNSCDTSCNVCNAQRAATHEEDAVKCDTTCSVCGEAVVATAQHTADACASACELCHAEVVPTHKFAGDCDAVCECGVERDVNAEHNYVDGACNVCGALEPVSCTHEYSNACDAECNLCFAIREDITHTYSHDCDTTCEYCDATREAAEHATYDNACDTTCICGAERVAPHNFTNDCQTKCADCDVTREPLADHTWTDYCDAACDVCGETRTAPHQYAGDCDEKCECGETRKATAEHNYVDGVCSVCGADKPAETKVNVIIKDYASAKSWANGTKYTTVDLDSIITATASGSTNTGKYYTSGYEWRFYQTESAKITITAKNGKIIESVKITYTSDKSGVLKYNGNIVTSGTVVAVNAESIQFTVGNSGSATNGQAKITAIEVIYREPCDHTNDQYLCDTICSNCGMTVEATAEHTVDDGCDVDCNVCGTAVTPTHEDDDILCDKICGNCDAEVAATAEHTYDDDRDADCNVCGDVRVPPASCEHTNADACDTVCPDCDEELAPTHKWASDCDTTCECGETREALADHSYTHVCSTECDDCGATREADHVYTDGKCECGAEEPAQSEPVTVTKTAQSYGYSDAKDINNTVIAVDDVISFTASKGSGSTTPKYYNNGTNFRIYAKNTLKFTALEGYKITSISVTCSGTSNIPKSGNYTITSGNAATSGSTVTFSGVDASTWTLTNTGSSQIRITSFTIVYEKI